MFDIAYNYFKTSHESTNHLYDGKPYFDMHILRALKWCDRFIYLIKEDQRENVRCGVLGHDSFEDCRLTYNDIKKNTNDDVADIIYGVSNEKGKTRSERANDKYYDEMRQDYRCVFVKLCDRLANLEYSIEEGNMSSMYRKEHEHFKSKIFLLGEFDEMWNEIDFFLGFHIEN